jgi:hypothetical protein
MIYSPDTISQIALLLLDFYRRRRVLEQLLFKYAKRNLSVQVYMRFCDHACKDRRCYNKKIALFLKPTVDMLCLLTVHT